jgi:hypothetical protein
MANWPCDPTPHVPKGYVVQERVGSSLLRYEVFVTGCYTKYNEDLAIMRMQPPVRKDDFREVKAALETFFHDIHKVRTSEIHPCALGELMSGSSVAWIEKGSLVQFSALVSMRCLCLGMMREKMLVVMI